jgi:PKD repeat protein
MEPVIFDGYDGLLDPGEVADLIIKIQNIGSLYAENVDLLISTSDPFVNIVSQSFQTIDRINSFSETDMLFQLKASKNAPAGHNAEMLLTLTDHQLINEQIPFTLVLGKLPVAIVRLSADSGSASAIKMSLDSLHVPYEFHYTLPARINHFSSLFVLPGINPSSSHSLTMAESTKLSGYLSQGGKLYMESSAPRFYQDKTSLHNYFRCTAQKVQVYFYHSVLGTPGSFTESMNFNYVSPVIFALYNIVPLTPAFGIFTNTDSIPKCLQFAYGGDDFKTIGSIFEFGSLINGEPPSEKITLMRRYLEFFDVATPGPKALFHCSQNSICRWHTVDFTDDSFDNIASWQWEFPGGTPSVSTAQNPTVQYIDAGNYDVKLTVGDGIRSRSITKKNFINVHVCAGAPELTTKPELCVYPNPARNRVSIKFPGLLSQESKLYIFDLMGRKIMERSFNRGNMEGVIPLDVSSLQKGLYIIKLISVSFNETTKVVIE